MALNLIHTVDMMEEMSMEVEELQRQHRQDGLQIELLQQLNQRKDNRIEELREKVEKEEEDKGFWQNNYYEEARGRTYLRNRLTE
jgi:hypothetical protein